MFKDLLEEIRAQSSRDFKEATFNMIRFVNDLKFQELKEVAKDIGAIPEEIQPSSSEEKLYSKTSDIVLSKCFEELGLVSRPLEGRGDSADVIAKSDSGYNYSLVADAKCFRLSRTAKNQKDFKITNLSNWRGEENEYAVLVSPYFEYPTTKSQIYSLALDHNVCLLSWEHISIMLERGVKETATFSLETIWNSSNSISRGHMLYAERDNCLLPKVDSIVLKKIGISKKDFYDEMRFYKGVISRRSNDEIEFLDNECAKINSLTKEEAISELIKEKKLLEKKKAIENYIKSVNAREFDE